MQKRKQIILDLINGMEVPRGVKSHLKKLLGHANTPREFDDYVYNFTKKIDVFKSIRDDYNNNWHFSYCSCDECEELRKKQWEMSYLYVGGRNR